ncbi:uncharacterized protein [Eurosta solidaginis]|uniref:uncharacterized protein n=1 Tax=Eurosta solidaginis TaxID=178769 RepID=UPI003530D559
MYISETGAASFAAMSKIVTTRQQYSRLLELLQQQPEMAQGFTKCPKEDVHKFWENVANELNSLGPPTKDVTTWKKVYVDWKSYVKRKLMENKREQTATGGGRNRQHSLTDLEEGLIELVSLETCTSGCPNTISVGLPQIHSENTPEAHADVSMASATGGFSQPSRRSTPQKSANSPTYNLLKEQIGLQESFYKENIHKLKTQEQNFQDIATGIRRLYRGTEKLCDLKIAQVEESREHNRLIAEKNEIKKQMLKVEEKSLKLLNK